MIRALVDPTTPQDATYPVMENMPK
jgi:hypothetical protein